MMSLRSRNGNGKSGRRRHSRIHTTRKMPRINKRKTPKISRNSITFDFNTFFMSRRRRRKREKFALINHKWTFFVLFIYFFSAWFSLFCFFYCTSVGERNFSDVHGCEVCSKLKLFHKRFVECFVLNVLQVKNIGNLCENNNRNCSEDAKEMFRKEINLMRKKRFET